MIPVRLLLLGLCALPGSAQTSSGVIFGDVHTSAGNLLPGVTVQVRDQARGIERTASTSSMGEYRIDDLRPGLYLVSAAKPGFRTLRVTDFAIEVNQKARLDMELVTGEEIDTITVKGEAALLQTGEASEGYLLQYATVRSLPLAGRNIASLVTLGPGAIPRQLGGFGHDVMNDLQGNRGAVEYNPPVNGARSTLNAHVFDGAYNTDRNTYSIVITPPLESVQEFRIQSLLAPAQAVQAGGAVIDIVSKSGSKTFHGSAFEFLRNEATDALGFFGDPSLPKPVFRQNQFGASLGGPLGLPRTFFFGTYEGMRNRSATANLHLVPDAAVRSGDFSGRSPIYDPLNLDPNGARRPFAGNRIPTNRIDPIATKFLSTYEPLPNHPGDGSNYLDSTPSNTRNDHVLVRIDHQLPGQTWLFGRYSLNEEPQRLAGFFPQLPTSERLRAQQAALGYTTSIGSWLNEGRVSFTRLRVFDLPESAFKTNVIRDLGMTTDLDDPFTYGLPFFVITNFDTVTDSPTLPQVQRDNTWNVTQGFSRSRGRHTLQTGFQWIYFQLNYLQSQFPRGQYLYTGTFTSSPGQANTGDSFGDFLLGYPQTTKRFAGRAQAYMRQNNVAAYLQDDYRILPGIILTLGLRYEYMSPYTEKRDALLNLDYSRLPAAPSLKRVNEATSKDWNNFSPRVGFAWRLPAVVLRGGYGVYFQPEVAVETYDLVRNGLTNEVNQITGTQPVLTTRDGFPKNAGTGLPTYFGLDSHARTPYMQQWSVGFQKQIGGVLGELAYIGSKGTKLGRFRTFNTPAHVETGENLAPRPGELQSLRTFPQFGPLYQRQHIANSNFQSLQAKAERRFNRGFSFLASFVWSKSIDDADTVVPGMYDSWGAQDERNLRLERGLSFFDVRRRFSAAFSYQIPKLRGFRVVRNSLGNWEFSGIITMQDGTPLNPVYFAADFANSGTPNRPQVVPGVDVRLPASQRSISEWFNRDAYTDPKPLTFGNAGRNTLPGPPNQIFDVSIHRRFPIGERQVLQLRAEGFNVFNHPNLGIPGPYPDFGPFFGKIFVAGPQRRLQFGLRYDF